MDETKKPRLLKWISSPSQLFCEKFTNLLAELTIHPSCTHAEKQVKMFEFVNSIPQSLVEQPLNILFNENGLNSIAPLSNSTPPGSLVRIRGMVQSSLSPQYCYPIWKSVAKPSTYISGLYSDSIVSTNFSPCDRYSNGIFFSSEDPLDDQNQDDNIFMTRVPPIEENRWIVSPFPHSNSWIKHKDSFNTSNPVVVSIYSISQRQEEQSNSIRLHTPLDIVGIYLPPLPQEIPTDPMDFFNSHQNLKLPRVLSLIALPLVPYWSWIPHSPPTPIDISLDSELLRNIGLNPLPLSLDFVTSSILKVPPEKIFTSLLQYFTEIFRGDTIAATLCIYTISARLDARIHDVITGRISTNFQFPADASTCVSEELPLLIPAFRLLLPHHFSVLVNPNSLKTQNLVPVVDEQTDLLKYGSFQAIDGTVIVFDETKLTTGTFEGKSIFELGGIQSILLRSTIPIKFPMQIVDFPVDYPVISFSHGKSILHGYSISSALKLNLPVSHTLTQLSSEQLTKFRGYLSYVGSLPFSIPSSLGLEIQHRWVKLREASSARKPVPKESFHLLLNILRAHCLCRGKPTPSITDWDTVVNLYFLSQQHLVPKDAAVESPLGSPGAFGTHSRPPKAPISPPGLDGDSSSSLLYGSPKSSLSSPDGSKKSPTTSSSSSSNGSPQHAKASKIGSASAMNALSAALNKNT